MPARNRKKKQPEDYHSLAESRGFRWLGPEVPTSKTLTTWECPKGHQWKAIYNNIQQGRDCPYCNRRKTLVDYHLLAKKRDFQWLGPEVTSTIKLTQWQCEFGHRWEACYRDILRGDNCPKCLVSITKDELLSATKDASVNNSLRLGSKETEDGLPDRNQNLLVSHDWWGKKSINFLKPLFASTKGLVRLSTGFFSIQGYSLLKSFVENKRVDIMVGFNDDSKDELKKTLIDEIMEDLSKWYGSRREAVLHLVQKLERRELRVVDARFIHKDHSKIYIFDNHIVSSGSTNLTKSGLQANQEADLTISKEGQPDRIEWWCKQYDMYWNSSEDISEMLLKRLSAWLDLYRPWDIYLKTIQALALSNRPILPRENYKVPAEFQMIVVDRAIRQLGEYRGAMIVASTGLGKTIMATHIAYVLTHSERSILNVLVVAPKPIKDEWQKRLLSAGASFSIHTRNLLDMPINEDQNRGALDDLLNALSEVDDKWMIIIDESQHFKNRERGQGGERRSFKRLIDAINKKKCLVLLLTATPYSTEVDNINHQLLLLPHTNPKEIPHQRAIPGLEVDNLYLRSWKVKRVEDLIDLQVSTVINTPYVAQNFAIESKEGDYLLFGDTKKYIPKIQVSKVNVPVILEEEITKALDAGYFKHKLMRFQSRGKWSHSTSGAENEVIISWGSSPWALKETLRKTILEEEGYSFPYILSREERETVLKPLVIELERIGYEDDTKFMRLYLLVKQLRQDDHKVLIFSERRITTVYIASGLKKFIPDLRIANTVKQNGDDYLQKDFQEVYKLMCGFAPRANPRGDGTLPEDKYDVFITTDAYSEGVNLQDASVVIHYDIAWTPETIIQRAGRILRFWSEPRMVQFYIFTGAFQLERKRNRESLRLQGRINKLVNRTKEAEKFTEIPIIPEDTLRFDTLRGLSSITIERLGYMGTRNLEDERLEVSTFLTHLAELKNNTDYVKTIPDDITSALTTHRVRTAKLYVLIKSQKKFHWIFYDINKRRIERIGEDQLLDKIQCSQETPAALIEPNEIEEYRRDCINLWCQINKITESDREELRHICSLYLSPEEQTVRDFLSQKPRN